MAYEMDMKKGLYPDEPGYIEFKAANFPNEMAIEGTLTKEFQYIHPQKFHKKFLDKRLCGLNSPTYTDIKVRNDIEMTNNKRYFQPKSGTWRSFYITMIVFITYGTKTKYLT